MLVMLLIDDRRKGELGDVIKVIVVALLIKELEMVTVILLFVPPPLPTPLRVGLGVIEGEEPCDNDDVGDAVTVILLVAVFEKEEVGEELEVIVPELDEEAVGVREEDDVIDIVTLSVWLGDIGALGLMLALAPRESVAVGV